MLRLALMLGAALLSSAGPSLAQDKGQLDGVWQTISDTDHRPRALIRISTVDGTSRGVVAASLRAGEDPRRVCDRCRGARRGRPILGMEVLSGLEQDPGNPRLYTGGAIVDPDTGGVYRTRVELSPDGRTLTVRGYVGVAILGRTQTWHRKGAPEGGAR